eukprot:2987719-Pleurochrysis_carterae.AAC.1
MARRVPYASIRSSSVDLSAYVKKDEQNGIFVQYNPSLGLSTNNTGITVVKKAPSEFEIDFSQYSGSSLIASHSLVDVNSVVPNTNFNVLQNITVIYRLYADQKKIIVFTTDGDSFASDFGFSLSVTSYSKVRFYIIVAQDVLQNAVSISYSGV